MVCEKYSSNFIHKTGYSNADSVDLLTQTGATDRQSQTARQTGELLTQRFTSETASQTEGQY